MHAAVHLICVDIASSWVHLRSASSQDRYCNTSPINIHCPVAVATRSLTAETYSIYTKLGNLPQTKPNQGNWLVRSLGICAITGKKSCTDTQKGLQSPLGHSMESAVSSSLCFRECAPAPSSRTQRRVLCSQVSSQMITALRELCLHPACRRPRQRVAWRGGTYSLKCPPRQELTPPFCRSACVSWRRRFRGSSSLSHSRPLQ